MPSPPQSPPSKPGTTAEHRGSSSPIESNQHKGTTVLHEDKKELLDPLSEMDHSDSHSASGEDKEKGEKTARDRVPISTQQRKLAGRDSAHNAADNNRKPYRPPHYGGGRPIRGNDRNYSPQQQPCYTPPVYRNNPDHMAAMIQQHRMSSNTNQQYSSPASAYSPYPLTSQNTSPDVVCQQNQQQQQYQDPTNVATMQELMTRLSLQQQSGALAPGYWPNAGFGGYGSAGWTQPMSVLQQQQQLAAVANLMNYQYAAQQYAQQVSAAQQLALVQNQLPTVDYNAANYQQPPLSPQLSPVSGSGHSPQSRPLAYMSRNEQRAYRPGGYNNYNRNGKHQPPAPYVWSGEVPPRVDDPTAMYSNKIFVGGVPWDITEQALLCAFKPYGACSIEWPGKDGRHNATKVPAVRPPPANRTTNSVTGYVYVVFDDEQSVHQVLSDCTKDVFGNGGEWYFKLTARRMRTKEIRQVQIIPWMVADAMYVKQLPTPRLDPKKTVFVGALHGMITAGVLFRVMEDLFGGVIFAGIDTDKHKYPIGSGRVTFNNQRSYFKAIEGAYIEIKTSKFTKRIQIDPFLEDSTCSVCETQAGPYFCRDMACFRYYCRPCWQTQHQLNEAYRTHKPLMRNARRCDPQSMGAHVGGGGSNEMSEIETSGSSGAPGTSSTGNGGGGGRPIPGGGGGSSAATDSPSAGHASGSSYGGGGGGASFHSDPNSYFHHSQQTIKGTKSGLGPGYGFYPNPTGCQY